MNKREALKIILTCSKIYNSNLNNRNLIFIYNNQGKVEYIETLFLPRNFLHLTGIELIRKTGASKFYNQCLSNKLSLNDFEFKRDGTTVLKLQILNKIVNIHQSAKMIGDYDDNGIMLHTDKIAGTTYASLGFVFENGFYIPNTALNEDIRKITNKPQGRVLAIYSKNIQDYKYVQRLYLAKNVDTNNFTTKIKNMII